MWLNLYTFIAISISTRPTISCRLFRVGRKRPKGIFLPLFFFLAVIIGLIKLYVFYTQSRVEESQQKGEKSGKKEKKKKIRQQKKEKLGSNGSKERLNEKKMTHDIVE